jgi:hypothetical protein
VIVKRISLVLLTGAMFALGILASRGVAGEQTGLVLTCAGSTGTVNVGTVSTVVSAVAKVNSSSAFSGMQLKSKKSVCTDGTGRIKYTLTRTKTSYCDSGTPVHKSKVVIYPGSTTIAHWPALAGANNWSWCHAAGKGNVVYSASGKAKLTTTDPLFGVFVDRDASTTAKVVLGFLDVSGGKERVIVGPSQQITVAATGALGAVVRIALSDGDRTTVAGLRPLVAAPTFARPPAGNSAVLKRIYATGTIRVGYDSEAGDSQVVNFVKRYYSNLARDWKVELALIPVPAAEAPAALAAGEIDVEVTPAAPSDKVTAFPFFERRGVLWRNQIVPNDPGWNAGLRNYVVATLNTGRYGVVYEAAFGVQPSYEPLRPLLFP